MHARVLTFKGFFAVALGCSPALFGQITNLPGTKPLTIEEINEAIAQGWAGER